MLFRVVSTSTGAVTASPLRLAVSTALLLRAVSAVVWPFLSVLTVPVEPLAALFSVTELPSFLVSVLVTEPSLFLVVSVLTVPLLEVSRSEEEPPPPLEGRSETVSVPGT